MKKILAIALVAVLMLSLLTACSGGGNDTPSGGGNNNTPSNSTPSGNGGDNSTPGGNNDNSDDSAKGYPDEWNDEIPKMNGTVKNSLALRENSYTAFVDVKNEDVINAYIDSLVSAGYEKTTDAKDGNHRNVGLKNGTWAIVIDYGTSGDELQVQLGYSPDVG